MVAPSSGSWTRVPNGPTPYEVFAKPIVKSQQDDREYRLIRLENGLQAMIVHDAKADKAAASLDVAVGHLYDPDDMPGLAHFCEHLLFMGTEQFPKENEYSEYLSKNNGHSNAYTSTSNTNYHFTVSTSALNGALERFSGFFHSPLFAPSCTVRELNAVDSEHKKNLQSDIWRIFQVNKHLSKPGHPWSKFGSGNQESLSKAGREVKAKGALNNGIIKSADGSLAPTPVVSRSASPAPSVSSANSELEGDGGVVGRETRRRLVEWWSTEYCASRMRLCVIGRESLDELAKTVATLFSPIPNRGRESLPLIPDHPFGPNEMGTLVSLQTVMSFHALEVSWPMPYLPPYWRRKPALFLAQFLGHEGPGSLHSYLKQKGWIINLHAGPQNLARGFGMFRVTLEMTQQGFDNYQTLVLTIFKYISLLQSSQFAPWHQRERALIHATRFRFAEKRQPEDYAIGVVDHMAWPVPRESILSAPHLLEEWDEGDPENGGEKEMRGFLNSLTIDQSRTVLMALPEEFVRVRGEDIAWQKEPWYGTPYCVERYSDELVKGAKEPNDLKEFFLPGPNEFIPTNLDVDKREVEQPAKRPSLIRETPYTSLWHKKDDQFWVPKAQVLLDIRSPASSVTARAAAMTRLFVDLVTDSLTEFSYDADVAGLNYSLTAQRLGVFVKLSGYNDKLHVLAKDVIERVRTLEIKSDRLEVMKEQANRDYTNFYVDAPYRIASYYTSYLLSARDWTMDELKSEVTSITADELRQHVDELLSKLHIRLLVTGNMLKHEACQLAEMVEGVLQCSPVPADSMWDLSLVIPRGSEYIWSAPVPNKDEQNSSLSYYINLAKTPDRPRRVLTALIAHILSEPAFDILRTKEQLGYIVSAADRQLQGGGQHGLIVYIQSERDPLYLEHRVDTFLREMCTKLENMSDEEFLEHKSALRKRWEEANKNLNEEFSRFTGHVISGYLDFQRREIEAQMLAGISKDEVLAFYKAHVDPSSSQRAKLSVHLKSQKPRPAKISVAAMEAFAEKVAEKGYKVDEQAWRSALASEGDATMDKFGNYWREALLAQAASVPPQVAQSLIVEASVLVEKYPATGDVGKEELVPDPRTVFIHDIKTFRASLPVNERPRPMVEWGDLPTSKF